MSVEMEKGRFLRRVLYADALTSGVSGVALVAAPALVARAIGLASGAVTVAGVGLLLLAYALWLVTNARRPLPRREEALAAIALNLAWVAGTGVVVAAGWLSRPGSWAVLAVADVVLAFAVLEIIGIRKMGGGLARGTRTQAVG